MAEEIWNLDSPEPAKKKGWWERKTGDKLKIHEKVLGVFFLIFFLFVFYVTLDANKYTAEVRVIEGQGKVGVNPTTEKLDFGDLSQGTRSVRMVTVNNSTPVPMFVSVIRLGSISSLTSLSKNNFMLRSGEEQQMEFTVYMPPSAAVGSRYSGRVFIFKIPAPFL
jgi:di/tricarboxylate transporter